MEPQLSYRFELPSTLGSEKIAMARVAEYASLHGAPAETVEDLKTLVSEACLNSMEHGNLFHEQELYSVEVCLHETRLTVCVCDSRRGVHAGAGDVDESHADGGASVADVADRADEVQPPRLERGRGLQIINELADDWHFSQASGRTCLEMEVVLP